MSSHTVQGVATLLLNVIGSAVSHRLHAYTICVSLVIAPAARRLFAAMLLQMQLTLTRTWCFRHALSIYSTPCSAQGDLTCWVPTYLQV